MKSQRRHELQANELAKQLETFPETLKRNATTIMLIITGAVVVFFLMRYRTQAAEQRSAMLGDAMASVRQLPGAIRLNEISVEPGDKIVARRNQIINDLNTAIDNVLREADGDNAQAMRAEALCARGDMNWALANTEPLPGATTQPSFKLSRTRDDYLKAAEDAYRDVVQSYAGQVIPWVSAEFGLAAIAQNRGDWKAAEQDYRNVQANKSVPDSFRAVADFWIARLPEYQEPSLIGPYPTRPPTTQKTESMVFTPIPTSQPIETMVPNPSTPSTQPTTLPTTSHSN